ncbi:MAG: extracellular solute-binding protein [Thermomicrobiales bacterium]|nr:extracellular solute-binding protein [Thermomicrobiales bacterium]
MARTDKRFDRRTLLKSAGGTAAAATMISLPGLPTRAQSNAEIVVSAQAFSHEPLQPFVDEFTAQTGIAVTFFANPAAGGEQVAQLTPQFASSSTPVDVLSSSDEAAPLFIRAGWMEPLNEIVDETFWSDFDQSVRDYVAIWSSINDEVFRIPHGWSVGFNWVRQDLLDGYGLTAPETWDDIRVLGEAAAGDGMFAFADAASKPSLAFVYAAYIVAQSGGNIFAFDEQTRAAFEFARELIDSEFFPRDAANWTYDQLNASYMGDQLVTMRQWSFFYDVARDNTEWFAEEKASIVLPPGAPDGQRATWAGAWGWMIPKFSENKEAALEFIKYISAPDLAGPLAEAMSDYIIPRTSVFDYLGDEGLVRYHKEYAEAGVITPRPFHPRVSEAQAIVDTYFNGYLLDQYSIDDVISNGQAEIAALDEV